MPTVKRVPTLMAHVIELSHTMREADVTEVALLGYNPRQALELSYLLSKKCWTYIEDGKVLCIVGITKAPDDNNTGIPWMLATEEAFSNKARFLRANSPMLEELSQGYSGLWNIVHKGNRKAIRWLEWLGFEFKQAWSHEDFYEFYKECN
ncbi:MAG: hypothetical protein KGI54_08320 [Pseudomonadota bacterium]|nr:hypothetical protein [Pseudomonadota bacterium]